jgi:hypothetical protein
MRDAIWQDLFDKSLKDFPASKAVIKNLRLGKVAMKPLTTVKLKSLSRKYSTSLSYYPEVSNLSMDKNNSTEVNIPGETTTPNVPTKRFTVTPSVPSKKMKTVKKASNILFSPSILQFVKKLDVSKIVSPRCSINFKYFDGNPG